MGASYPGLVIQILPSNGSHDKLASKRHSLQDMTRFDLVSSCVAAKSNGVRLGISRCLDRNWPLFLSVSVKDVDSLK